VTDLPTRNAELLHAVIADRHPHVGTVRRGRYAREAIGYPVRSAPEACRVCGETMVLIETTPGAWEWYELGPCFGTRRAPGVRMIRHTPARCAERAARPAEAHQPRTGARR
jgi:hypothetical protein